MGTRGPLPKREDMRKRRNKDSEGPEVTKLDVEGEVVQPAADPDWHPIAQQLWEAMGDSGQSMFYEPSDWAVAYSLMDDLTYYKRGTKRSGQMLQTIMSSLTSLLLTEGDRRRVALELNRKSPSEDNEDEKVAVMDKWRQRLG